MSAPGRCTDSGTAPAKLQRGKIRIVEHPFMEDPMRRPRRTFPESSLPSGEVADCLRRYRDRIKSLWERRVRRQPGLLVELSHPILHDVLPELLGRISDGLASNAPPASIPAAAVDPEGTRQGRPEPSILREVIDEYAILLGVVMGVIEVRGVLRRADRERIIRAIFHELRATCDRVAQRWRGGVSEMEATLHRILVASELSETAFWEWNVETDEVWRSENHHRLYGLRARPERWGFELLLEHVHPDDREKMRTFARYARVPWPTRDGKPFMIEYRVCWPDGTERWLLSQGRICRDAQGPGVVCIGSVANITEKKQAEEKLADSERRFREVANAVPQILWVARADGRKVYANDRWYEYTGLTPEQSAGEGWKRAVHPDDLPGTMKRWEEAVRSGQPLALEERLRSREGDYRWFLARATPVKDAAGRVWRWYGTNTDIHEQRRTLEDFRSERELRERMVAMLSHDMRAPLTAVKAAAELIRRQHGDSELQDTLARRIVRDIDRSDRMIRDMLDASRIRAGEDLKMDRQPCDLARIATEVTEAFSTVNGPRFFLHADQPVEGFWNADGMKRILENLLSNAVKYGQPGTPIDIFVRGQAERVLVSVHNVGNPISEEDQRTLFQVYRRTRSAEKSGQGGWGLGLALVHGIVSAHGGQLSVSSDARSGTTFTVVLPKEWRGAELGKAA